MHRSHRDVYHGGLASTLQMPHCRRWCFDSGICRVLLSQISCAGPVPSPRGGFVGFTPPQTKLQAHQIEIWNTINHWNFCQILMSSPPCTNVKPPYWRLSGDGSALDTSEPGWLALKLPELIVSRKGTLCVIANSHSLLWKFRPSARGFNLHALGCVLVAAVVVYSSAAALVSR